MKTPLKEHVIVKELAAKRITESVATQLLNESNDGMKFSAGESVYVAHGIHAGSFGKFISEGNGGYANVDIGAAGKTKYVPIIFLQRSQNGAK